MAQRLNIKDSIQQWIDKINAALDLQNVDGAFVNNETSWTDTTLVLTGGKIRVGTAIVDVAGDSLVLPTNSVNVVGIDTDTGTLTSYLDGNVPTTDFIPLYIATTNVERITNLEDARTWAYEDSGAAEAEVSAHEAKPDPHSQYATDQDLTDHVNAADPHTGYTLETELADASNASLGSALVGHRGSDVRSELDRRIIYVGTIDDLKALPTATIPDGQHVEIREYAAGTGVGEGKFFWDASSTDTSDDGLIFTADDTGTGRWKRITESRRINIEWFGAVPDGIYSAGTPVGTDNTAAIQAAINTAANSKVYSVFVPSGHFLYTTLYFYNDLTLNPGFPDADFRDGRISLIGEKAGDYASAWFDELVLGSALESTVSSGSGIIAGSGASAGTETSRRVEIKDLVLLGNTSGDVLDINGAPQLSIFENLTVINKADGGNAIHVHNGSYVCTFRDIHCSAQGNTGVETGFWSEQGGLNTYMNITATGCGGAAIIFGNDDGDFGTANVLQTIQARQSTNGIAIKGGRSCVASGLWMEQNSGNFDLRISHGATGWDISGAFFGSTALSTAHCILGNNSGDPAIDTCKRIKLTSPSFFFVGPTNIPALLKWKDCGDLVVESPSFKNNGGKAIAIDDSGPITITRVTSPDWFPDDAGSQVPPINRVVSYPNLNDAKELANVDDIVAGIDGIASTSITNATNNGSGLIRITSSGHGLLTGELTHIAGVGGTTEANGDWEVVVINSSTFDLVGSSFTNPYTSGGSSTKFALDMRTWKVFPETLQTTTISGSVYIALPSGPYLNSDVMTVYKPFVANNLRVTSFGGSIGGSEFVDAGGAGDDITVKHIVNDVWKLI